MTTGHYSTAHLEPTSQLYPILPIPIEVSTQRRNLKQKRIEEQPALHDLSMGASASDSNDSESTLTWLSRSIWNGVTSTLSSFTDIIFGGSGESENRHARKRQRLEEEVDSVQADKQDDPVPTQHELLSSSATDSVASNTFTSEQDKSTNTSYDSSSANRSYKPPKTDATLGGHATQHNIFDKVAVTEAKVGTTLDKPKIVVKRKPTDVLAKVLNKRDIARHRISKSRPQGSRQIFSSSSFAKSGSSHLSRSLGAAESRQQRTPYERPQDVRGSSFYGNFVASKNSNRSRQEHISRSYGQKPAKSIGPPLDSQSKRLQKRWENYKSIPKTEVKFVGEGSEAFFQTLLVFRETAQPGLENYEKVQARYKKVDDETKAAYLRDTQAKEEKPQPLDDKNLQNIKTFLMSPNQHKELRTIGGCLITPNNLRTLSGTAWLNDEVINAYINLLKERSNPKGQKPSLMVFNSMFFASLRDKGYSGIARWSKRAGAAGPAILDLSGILIPIHNSLHWTLAYVNIQKKRFEYYDSLHGSWNPIKYLRQYMKSEVGPKYVDSEWEDYYPRDSPDQMNGFDCGVFLCKTAEVITRDGKFSFTQQDIPTIRRVMQADLMYGKFDWR